MTGIATATAVPAPAQGALFDYEQLDAETRIVVQQRAGEIQQLVRTTTENVIQIGHKLADVKDRLNGRFNAWLQAEFDWSERTAYNFIAVWQKFGHRKNVAKFATSALYLLSAPHTPAEAVVAAEQIAESGEKVSHAVAKELVRSAKARQPKQVTLDDQIIERDAEESDTATGAPAPIAVEVSQAELEQAAAHYCGNRLSSDKPFTQRPAIPLYHLGEQSLVVTAVEYTGAAPYGQAPVTRHVIAYPAQPLSQAGEPAAINGYIGLKVRAGAHKDTWVIVGPETVITARQEATSAPEQAARSAPAVTLSPEPTELPAGWEWDETVAKAGGARAINPERGMKTLIFASAREACIAAHYLESDPATAAMGAKAVVLPAEQRTQPQTVAPAVERPAAWLKSRIEINITLMPGDSPETRKVLYSVRAGEDTPFVKLEAGEADALDSLPIATLALLARVEASLAAKPAAKAAAGSAKAKAKPAAKKSIAKTPKAKKGARKNETDSR